MKESSPSLAWRVVEAALCWLGAAVFTGGFFLVLPLLQAISGTKDDIVRLIDADVAPTPPPPPAPEEPKEAEPEEKPDEKPPELSENAPPLDLAQLELALSPGMGGAGGDFAVKLDVVAATAAGAKDVDALFSLSDLDQKPRPIYQPSPALTPELRKKGAGTVYVLFVVGPDGRVEQPIAQSSTDPVFERPALAAVKQWKFEPGKRKGQPVRFRMRVPVTFAGK
ncbi:MAG TPA: TonB family protein [Planctomycetota bacterium]|nr:TonB family protein [Planctomycetota bacterium]